MSQATKKRIVMQVGEFPKLSETFLVRKFLGLIDHGWDVHLLRHKRGSDQHHFPELTERADIQSRVHDPWPHRPRLLAALLIPFALLLCFLKNPTTTLRYLKTCREDGLSTGQSLRAIYLDAKLIELAPNLVHFEFGSFAAGRMHLKKRLGCLTMVSFRGFDLNIAPQGDSDFIGSIWDSADAIHLLGESLLETALRRGCPTNMPMALIPPAVDLGFFCPSDTACSVEDAGETDNVRTKRTLKIVSIGRLHWKKGYEYALQAVRLLLDRGIDCEYQIVGNGNYLNALAFARFELDLIDRVTFCGALSPLETLEKLRWSDVLLHAAVTEGFCNAVVEAQATATPVICTDAGGLPENIEDGVTGYLVPRRDPAAMADKLALLALDPGQRLRLGSAGRERAQDRYRIEDQVAAFGHFYDTTLGADSGCSAEPVLGMELAS